MDQSTCTVVPGQTTRPRFSFEVIPRPDIIHPGVSYLITPEEGKITALVRSRHSLTSEDYQCIEQGVAQVRRLARL